MKPLILIGFFVTAFIAEKSLTKSFNLSCVLTSDKTVYKVGELPKFTVNIFNQGKEDIYLIGSLDGSDVKWRFPYCYYSIERPKKVKLKLGRCGNMNTLKVADFRLIKTGEKFNPYDVSSNEGYFEDYTTTNAETFRNPGVYKLQFHYSTNSPNISDFTGDQPFRTNPADSILINSFFEKVPKVDIVSNEIEIRIEE